jgi:carboxyl-terminal processing protease
MMKMSRIRFALFVVVIFVIGGAAGMVIFGMLPEDSPLRRTIDGGAGGAGTDASAATFARISELEAYLKENYYEPVSDGAIETGLLRGLFSAPGDPYTIYYTEEEFAQTMEKTHGELSGVGLTLTPNDDGAIEVIGVIEGSPAEAAGIKKGDLLLAVDGKAYPGEKLSEAVEAARGEAGTTVVLSISRDGRTQDYTITRSVFVTPTVEKEIVKSDNGQDIGIIRVSSFNDNTAEDFDAALEYMNGEKVKGFVVDVRNNTGGLVDQAVRMCDMILDEGVICYAEGAHGDRVTYSTKNGRATDLPYDVVIDGTSVSAAEIFALGVKAQGGGKLVGETTYGKGLIQKLDKFKAGDGVRITIMQYITPDGEPVNGVGVAPDVVVAAPEDAEQESDPQLDKAVELLAN